jgi:hypothetical protein
LACCALLAGVVLTASAATCPAGFMNYGNRSGATVDYLDITESSSTDVPLLFGNPIVSGDSLDFNPIVFHATSLLGAPPMDTTDGRLLFTMVAKPNNGISNLLFSEGGVFIVAGSGTSATYTSVRAAGNLDIYDVDGASVNTIKVPIDLVFTHTPDGIWDLTEGVVNGLPWTGSQFIDLNAELASRNITFTRGVTRLAVVLDNVLFARSEANSSAMIDKKDFGFHVRVNVPEPTTACLGLVAMLGGVLLARGGQRN